MLDKHAKQIIGSAAIYGAITVILGAFGAHGLKSRLDNDQLASFETGIRYLFIHLLASVLVGILMQVSNQKSLRISAYLFFIGSTLFSGSIFLLTTRELIGLENYKWLGPITPIGGLILILGWLTLAFLIFRQKNNEQNIRKL